MNKLEALDIVSGMFLEMGNDLKTARWGGLVQYLYDNYPRLRKKPKKVVGDSKGRYIFHCFARHASTGEVLLIYTDSGAKGGIHAMPFGQDDIFIGISMPDNKRFEMEESHD